MTQSVAVVRADTGEVKEVAPFDLGTFLKDLDNPTAIAQQKALSAAYDKACESLIGENDVQREGGRTFKKKSAWRKLARYFHISTEVVRVEREAIEGLFLATVTVRATAPWGQSAEAIGACCTDEATGRRVISVADAIATAETRATNRATSNLIAMGEVSAEELGDRKSWGERSGAGAAQGHSSGAQGDASAPASAPAGPLASDDPSCPKCGGRMWDNRAGKRNPKAPDYKCRNRSCDGVIWPPKDSGPPREVRQALDLEDGPPPDDDWQPSEEVPF